MNRYRVRVPSGLDEEVDADNFDILSDGTLMLWNRPSRWAWILGVHLDLSVGARLVGQGLCPRVLVGRGDGR